MVSDYRATIQRLSQSESRTEVFPNFPKTFQKPDQNFFKTVRKIERFFCAAGEGLSRARGLGGGGQLGRLGGGRQPPQAARSAAGGDHADAGGYWQRSGRVAGDPRTAIRRAVGCGSGSPPLLPLLPCRCHCGPAGCVAVAAAVGRCNAAVGRVRGRCGVFMAMDRYLTLSHKNAPRAF